MEPLLHFTIPFVVLVLAGIHVRKALPISALTLIPDLDVLFHIHKSISHSITIPMAVAMLLLLRRRVMDRNVVATSLLAVCSHSILDVFTGYTPIFWPLFVESIWLQVDVWGHMGSSLGFDPSCRILAEPSSFVPFQSLDAPLLTGDGLIVSAMLLTPLFLRGLRKSVKALHTARQSS